MPTVGNSKKQSRTSKKPSPAAGQQMSKLGSELVKGLRQALAHFRGDFMLRSYDYRIPEHIDVRTVRQKTGFHRA